MEKETEGKKQNNFSDLSVEQIEANIRKLVSGHSKNAVTRYKIVNLEAFLQNQREYEHLELIGVEAGASWGKSQFQTPNAVQSGNEYQGR